MYIFALISRGCLCHSSTSQVMEVSVTKYALLYSLYSWPNVILSVFGGYLLDRVLGVRLGTLIFSGFVCLGQVYNKTCVSWIQVPPEKDECLWGSCDVAWRCLINIQIVIY